MSEASCPSRIEGAASLSWDCTAHPPARAWKRGCCAPLRPGFRVTSLRSAHCFDPESIPFRGGWAAMVAATFSRPRLRISQAHANRR